MISTSPDHAKWLAKREHEKQEAIRRRSELFKPSLQKMEEEYQAELQAEHSRRQALVAARISEIEREEAKASSAKTWDLLGRIMVGSLSWVSLLCLIILNASLIFKRSELSSAVFCTLNEFSLFNALILIHPFYVLCTLIIPEHLRRSGDTLLILAFILLGVVSIVMLPVSALIYVLS